MALRALVRFAFSTAALNEGVCLQFQQEFLCPKSSAVSRQRAVASDDAVAWNKYGNGVCPVCVRHGADGFRPAYLPGERGVGDRRAVGDFRQCAPYGLLKLSAGKDYGNVECGSLAAKVFVQLAGGFPDYGRCLLQIVSAQNVSKAAIDEFAVFFRRPVAEAKLAVNGAEQQVAARRVVELCPNVFHIFFVFGAKSFIPSTAPPATAHK